MEVRGKLHVTAGLSTEGSAHSPLKRRLFVLHEHFVRSAEQMGDASTPKPTDQ